jgi:hypothetical protein
VHAHRVRHLGLVLASLALVVGCSGRTLGPGERPLPVANLRAPESPSRPTAFGCAPTAWAGGPALRYFMGLRTIPEWSGCRSSASASRLAGRPDLARGSHRCWNYSIAKDGLSPREGTQLNGGCQSADPNVWVVELARQTI